MLLQEADNLGTTMKEYVQFETERALRNCKVYNWETAKYGKINWFLDDVDVNVLKFFETKFPAIVYNDALKLESEFSSEPALNSDINLENETSLPEYMALPLGPRDMLGLGLMPRIILTMMYEIFRSSKLVEPILELISEGRGYSLRERRDASRADLRGIIDLESYSQFGVYYSAGRTWVLRGGSSRGFVLFRMSLPLRGRTSNCTFRKCTIGVIIWEEMGLP
ncbi:hypothetical protein Tco_0410204 [Tanacetum coccineum]